MAVQRRGKSIAISTVAVGVVVLVAAGFAAKDWIVEEWWIHKLQTGDVDEQTHAAKRLGELESIRAVPFLFRVIGEVSGKSGLFLNPDQQNDAGLGIVFSLKGLLSDEEKKNRTKLCAACAVSSVKITSESKRGIEPEVIRALQDDSTLVRALACSCLAEMRSPSEKAMFALRESLLDGDPAIRKIAAGVLKRIQAR